MSAKPRDPPCQKVVELVNAHLGHTLTVEDREAFDAHLENCPPCRIYLEQMETVLSLAGSLGSAPTTKDVELELLALFRRWHEKGTRGP